MRPRAIGALAAVGALLLSGGAVALAAEAPAVTRQVLPNGMTVLVRPSRAARVVAISLQVDGGSVTDTAATSGITNLVQRVMVRGTARRSAVAIAEAAEDLGGAIDAASDVEHAEIHGHALARHWETLLTLVAEVALEPAFRDEEIEGARRVQISQIQTRTESPLGSAMDALTRDLYGLHPYGLPPMGRREAIGSLTREALIGHHRRLYRPERMVLAVSGDVPGDRVVKRAERLFGRLARREASEIAPPPAPAPTRARRVFEQPAQQAQVLLGHLGPGLGEPDYAAVKVLTAVLGSGTSGRLFREVRDRQGLAYALGVMNASRRGQAAIVSYLGTEAANVATAEQTVRREIDRIRAEAPTAEEVARAKAYVLGTLAMDRRTNVRQAWYLAFFELSRAGWDFPERHARAVEAVTPDDVLRVARRYLDAPTTVIVVPAR